MKKLRWKLFICWLSFKWIFKTNLGDLVYYRDKTYVVANGVRANQWRLHNLENKDNGWVKRNECRKVVSISNMSRSFKSGYRFYMGYWFDIWVNEGIKPWMKKCNIW